MLFSYLCRSITGMDLVSTDYPVIDKKIIFVETKEVDMATYTITIDERTKSGKKVVDYH